jgi:hypothetical protein
LGRAGLELNSQKPPQPLETKELTCTPPTDTIDKTVQNPVHVLDLSPELDTVVKAWTALPDHVKQTILTLVDVSKKK